MVCLEGFALEFLRHTGLFPPDTLNFKALFFRICCTFSCFLRFHRLPRERVGSELESSVGNLQGAVGHSPSLVSPGLKSTRRLTLYFERKVSLPSSLICVCDLLPLFYLKPFCFLLLKSGEFPLRLSWRYLREGHFFVK